MPLDRQSIEKRDFPIGRRGYEPEAVDEHLARLADEIDALKRQSQSRGSESISAVASQQVASIVQAAESTAADLERQASEDAERIRRDAEAEARSTRNDAIEVSQAHVGKVGDSVSQMLQRVDAMESELGSLLESLRTGANRLQADLTLLQGNMGDLRGADGREPDRPSVPSEPREIPAPAAPEDPPPVPAADLPPAAEEFAAEESAVEEGSAITERVRAAMAAPADVDADADGDEDVEGARLIALNMALNGTPREETDHYLADNFDLADRGALLDEVYASIEG